MLSVMLKRVATRTPAVCRSFSSHTKPWDLFPTPEVPAVKPTAPQYMMNMRDNLEFALERMRLTEGPVALQLLNRNARRPRKANHGKRPCSHYRRRLKRLDRRSDK
ncbi:hypothetical protein JG688_00005925 [Phytophthora aleatoria]|uniref:Uncharacterized protein n=1 Tax=Phytophthora aleatoria TaxID=2496075 RepID=A0A8J5MHC1_9STRA|nr:hypothetical protein JG688_00005925 [Phytophthora aleatoria]